MKNLKLVELQQTDPTLVAEWRKLWDDSENASVFNSYEWFRVNEETYKIKNYRVFACYKKKQLIGVFPGILKKKYGFLTFSPISQDEHVPGSSILLKKFETKTIRYIINSISLKYNVFITHADENLARYIKKLDKKYLVIKIAKSPSIELSEKTDSFLAKSAKSKIEKIIRQNCDKLKYCQIKINSKNLDENMQQLLEIDQKSAKKLKGGGVFSNQLNIILFKNILTYCSKFVTINYLYHLEKPIAYMLNFSKNRVVTEFHTSYLSDFAKLSPGKILFYEILKNLKQKDFKTFRLGMSFFGLDTINQFQSDIYCTKNLLTFINWKAINSARRINQILFKRDYFQDYKFLFKEI